MYVTSDSVPIISSDWVLRNEKTYLILYKLSFTENKHFLLPPLLASLLPLFNGKDTCKRIAENIVNIFSLTSFEEGMKLLQQVVTYFNKIENIIIDNRDDRFKVNILKLSNFLINYEHYNNKIDRLTAPTKVSLVLTNSCQTDCIYCYAERRVIPKHEELSIERWKEIIDELYSFQIFFVELSGGDPCASPLARSVIYYLLKKGFLFFISTKSFLSFKFAESLIDFGFNEPVHGVSRKIQISVDSVIPGEASYLTGVSGYFKRAQKSITNLINAGIHPIVKSVLTPYNYKSFTETINYFTSIGVTEFQFVQYSRSPYRHRDDLFLTLEQKKWLSRTSEQLNLLNRKDINITIQTDTEEHDPLKRLNSKEWQDRSICSGGRSTFCILNNGDISLCEQMPHQPQYIFGNVSGSSVLNMWNNPKITNFLFAPRNQFLNSPCHDCAEFEICHFCKGYCYREALFNYGSVFDAPPDCPFQKKPALRRI